MLPVCPGQTTLYFITVAIYHLSDFVFSKNTEQNTNLHVN